jgi:hypothetical protein
MGSLLKVSASCSRSFAFLWQWFRDLTICSMTSIDKFETNRGDMSLLTCAANSLMTPAIIMSQTKYFNILALADCYDISTL